MSAADRRQDHWDVYDFFDVSTETMNEMATLPPFVQGRWMKGIEDVLCVFLRFLTCPKTMSREYPDLLGLENIPSFFKKEVGLSITWDGLVLDVAVRPDDTIVVWRIKSLGS